MLTSAFFITPGLFLLEDFSATPLYPDLSRTWRATNMQSFILLSRIEQFFPLTSWLYILNMTWMIALKGLLCNFQTKWKTKIFYSVHILHTLRYSRSVQINNVIVVMATLIFFVVVVSTTNFSFSRLGANKNPLFYVIIMYRSHFEKYTSSRPDPMQ